MKTMETTILTELADGHELEVCLGQDGRPLTFTLRLSQDGETILSGEAVDAERVVAALSILAPARKAYSTCPDHGRYDGYGKCPGCEPVEMRPAVAPAVPLKSAAQG